MSIGRKFRFLEPICRKLSSTISHVLAAKYSEREHLSRSQIRFESQPKSAPHRLRSPVGIAFLHLVVYLHPQRSHQLSTAGPKRIISAERMQ
jgi:hypothetical protein